jgi:AraC-like DNA-binding protein
MADWNLPRSPASAVLLTNLGLERDIPLTVSLRGTRLTPERLTDTRTTVSADEELRIVRNLIAVLDDTQGLGAEAGMRYHLTTHGIWGFALSSSPTLRSAITVGLRYVGLTFAFCEMSTVNEGNDFRLIVDPSRLPSDVRHFFVERELASIVNLGRQMMSDPTAEIRVYFTHSAPASTQPYEAFGVPPVFDAEANYAEFDADLLDRPLPQADAHTAAVTEAQCRRLLDTKRARSGFAGKVRDRLVVRPGAMPDIEAVAAGLHISSRTLRRHLDAEGTSYRALVDEVRERIAEELLTTGALTVEEIGQRLGYADTPSFTAAFKRWKDGIPPSRYPTTVIS